MLTALALAAVLGQAPSITADLNRTITFEHRAASAMAVVAALGKAVGVEMSASPALWTDVLLVRVENVKIPELMDRIADLTSSEWIRTNDGLYLRRSNSKVQADERAQTKERAQRLARTLDRLAKSIPAERTADDMREWSRQRDELLKQMRDPNRADPTIWERYRELEKKEPLASLASEALVAIGPNTLAEIQQGDRVVFSSQPTPMQRQLPAKLLLAAQKRLIERSLFNVTGSSSPVDDGLAEPSVRPGATPQDPALIHVAVECEDQIGLGALSVRVAIFDVSAHLIGSSSTRLEPVDDQTVHTIGQEMKSREGDVEIEIRDESDELAQFLTGPQSKLSAETQAKWRERMVRMDANEPLSFGASDALLSLSKKLNKNAIAVIPDMFVMFGRQAFGDKITVRGLMTLLREFPIVQLREEDRWLTMRPVFLSQGRRSRTNRSAASRFLAASVKDGWPSLANQAAYIAATDSIGFDNLGLILLDALGLRDNLAPFSSSRQQKLLRFYGRLTPNQLAALQTSGLAIASLTPEQAAPIRQLVFGAGSELIDTQSPRGSAFEDGQISPATPPNLRTEPTQVLSGLPSTGVIRLRAEPRPLIMMVRDASEPGLSQALPISQVAWELAMSERPELFPWIRDQKPVVAYRVQQETQLTITVQLTPSLATRGTLSDRRPPGPPVQLKDLPNDLRQSLEKELEQHRSSVKGMNAAEADDQGSRPAP